MKRVLAVVLCVVALCVAGPQPGRAEEWPSVKALFDVNFNGFNVGSFEFQSHSEEESYSLVGNAQLSLLLGAITWVGETRTFGLIADRVPKPAAFTFDFKSSAKSGSTKLGFDNGMVTSIAHVPPPPPKADIVPVRQQHLKGVLDPLSAIMVVARSPATSPCNRKLAIFDGKERFDLVLTYKGQIKVSEQQPSGQPGMAYVCRVKYHPVAGHKIDAENSHLATTDGIEVILRPIPSANVLVPYQVTIPTILGYATLNSKRIEIESPGKPQIALLH
jgi:hypothetical protein